MPVERSREVKLAESKQERGRGIWPEERWERRRPYVEVGLEGLRALGEALLGNGDVRAAEVLKGGKFNTNLKVSFDDGEAAVLRIYEGDQRACERDRRIWECVKERAPMAERLAGTAGDEALKEWTGGREAAFFAFVDGVDPLEVLQREERESCEAICFQFGKALAGINGAIRFSHHGLLDERLELRRRFESTKASFLEYLEWGLQERRIKKRLGRELAGKVERFGREKAVLLEECDSFQGLVHGDYKLSNLLLRKGARGWEIAAVLDWEFASAGTALFDAATMVRHSRDWDFDFEGAFGAGFRAGGGELPDGWREIVKVLDLMNLLGFLKGSGGREETFETVRALIAETLD